MRTAQSKRRAGASRRADKQQLVEQADRDTLKAAA
jgi:hypothetical protein